MQTSFRKIFENACGLLLLLAVVINFLEIPLRVFIRFSFDLLFDFPVWITIWVVLLVSGFVLLEDGHLSINFIRNNMKGAGRTVLEILLSLITLGYGFVITLASVQYIQTLYTKKMIFPRVIAIPQWIIYLCIPLGMGLFSFFALYRLIMEIKKGRWK